MNPRTPHVTATISNILTAKNVQAAMEQRMAELEAELGISRKKIGRNDPCPCGSGKKYKRCCL